MKLAKRLISSLVAVLLVINLLPISSVLAYSESIEGIAASLIPTAVIRENESGNMTRDYDAESDTYSDEYFRYYFMDSDFVFTVTYNGGQTFTGDSNAVMVQFGECPWFSDDQSYAVQWLAGKHEITVHFMDLTAKAEIEIEKSPIESISVVAKEAIVEGMGGQEWKDFIPETGEETESYYRYDVYNDWFKYTLELENGEAFTGSATEINEKFRDSGWNSCPQIDTEQSFENQWGIGKHKITVRLMGKSCESEIEIVKNPIESVSAVAVNTLTEGISGWMVSDWTEQGQSPQYFKYNINFDTLEYTVIYDGGKTFVGNRDELHQMFCNDGNFEIINSDQSYENQWGVGKHTVNINFRGKFCSAEIEITKCPIENISAVAVKTLSEGVSGYFTSDYTMEGQTEQYFKYSLSPDPFEITVTYDGGKTYTGSRTDVQQKFGNNQYYIDVTTDQSFENQWGVGKHTVNISFMGKSCSAEIEITKSPIDNISAVAVKTLTEGVDGWMSTDWLPDGQSEQYFRYNINYNTLEYTVTYDNGKTFVGNREEVQRKFGDDYSYIEILTDQSFDNQWGVGKQNVSISFLGKRCTAEIEVIKSPIESISAVASRPLLYKVDGYTASGMDSGEYFKYETSGLFTYTVVYDGGKSFTGSAEEIYSKFSCSPSITDDQSYGNQWDIGKHQVTVKIAGFSCVADIEIVANPYKSIQISGQNELQLTFTKHDNSVVTAKILGFVEYGGGQGECGGILTTDIGVFTNVRFSWYCTGDYTDNSRDIQLTIGTLSSNVLASNNWIKMREYSESIAYYTLAYQNDIERNILNFNGAITQDNINSIISLSYNVTGKLWNDKTDYINEGQHTYWLYDLDDVKETVSMLFDTTGVDFSGSRIDAASGKVMVEDVAIGGGNIKTTASFDAEKNCWSSVTQEFDDMNQSVRRTLTITYDTNNRVSSIVETHNHRLVFYASTDATCENDGFKAYCECTICGKLFTDESCSTEITTEDIIIPATGHHYVDTVVPPTTTQQGYTLHTCSKCENSYKDNYIPALAPQLLTSSVRTTAGKQIEVTLTLKNNPGIAGLAVSLKYDESVLTLAETKKGDMFSGFTAGKNFAWDESEDVTADGTLATFVFTVAENAEPGDYTIQVIPRSCTNENMDDVVLTPVNGVVTVIDFIYGDANGDEKIDMKDVVLLRKYIVNYDYDTETSSVVIEAGADANGDGNLDMKDVVLLRKYIANYDYDAGTSSIVLGPQ
ncbi:MAG TPA: hypothetical protein DER23_07285 [Clostridiales bacterium]|jgi:hypothetical protein|nr:hypothetical protein [Clostridiales bacterium]